MKTILALLKKDIASLRPLMWIWAIMVGFECLAWIPFPHAWTGDAGAIMVASLVLFVATGVASFVGQMLLVFLLIVRVIHADPLTESDAFWRTRPISRGALLAEKTLFITLLMTGTVIDAFAVRLHSADTSTADTLLPLMVFVSGLAAFTAVTSNFTKLILTFIGIALGAGMLAAILLGLESSVVSLSAGLFHFPMNEHVLFANHSGPFGTSLLYLGGCLTIVIYQYLTLKTTISRLALFVIFFLAALFQGG